MNSNKRTAGKRSNARATADLPMAPTRAPLPKPKRKPKPKPVEVAPVYVPYVAPFKAEAPVVIKPRVMSEYTLPDIARPTPVVEMAMPMLEHVDTPPRIPPAPGTRAWRIEQFVKEHFNIDL